MLGPCRLLHGTTVDRECIWGPQSIDLFTSGCTSQLPRFGSRSWSAGEKASRRGENAWASRVALGLKKFARADHHDIQEKWRLGNADADSTRGHGQMLLSSTGLKRHQPHLFLVSKSKSGWWDIPLRMFGGHPHKFKLSNSNSNQGGCLKPRTATKAQRQDVYPHVVMNVLPFPRAWEKAKNCQSPVLSEKVWSLVGVVTNVRIDSVSIAADPSPSLAPFLAKVLTLELTPTAKW